jgi:hypothetical protein
MRASRNLRRISPGKLARDSRMTITASAMTIRVDTLPATGGNLSASWERMSSLAARFLG